MNDGPTDLVLYPSARAQLTLLAANSINIPASHIHERPGSRPDPECSQAR